MSPQRILIFENDSGGHRLQFVRICVQAIADLDVEIVFATGASTPETDEFRTHITPVLDRITVDASLAAALPEPPLRSARSRLFQWLAAVERHQPGHVYIPYADGLAQMSAVTRLIGRPRRSNQVEVEGILMRGRFAYPRRSWRDSALRRAWLAATSAAPIDILHFLDPIPYEWILKRGGRLAARARLIPEPVEPPAGSDRREARERLGLPLEGRIVCCPGWLDERKGVDRLVRAFVAAAVALRTDDRLLLVGRVDPSVRAALQQASETIERGRIIVHEGVVSDEHLHRAIAAANVVATPYQQHIGSSGIVVRAAALERMVLASDFGWVGMVTERFGLGVTCDCRDDDAIVRVLPVALDASESFRPTPAARRFTRFHTQANHEAHLSRRLRQRLGRDADRETWTWDWVLQSPPGGVPPSTQAIPAGAASQRVAPCTC